MYAGLLDNPLGELLHMLNNWWTAFMAWLSSLVLGLINTALAQLPSGWQTSVETVRHWLEVANAWLPLDYMFDLLISYLVFELVWYTLKLGVGLFGVKVP